MWSRLALVIALASACSKKSDAPPAAGSGSAPAPGSAAAPIAIDAPPTTTDAAPPPPADAAAAATVLTKTGLSAIADYKRGEMSDADSVTWLQKKLPAFTVSFDVMDVTPEREEGYFSVKKGETEVAQLFRAENGTLETRVLGAFPTDEGISVGQAAGEVFARHPETACAIHDDSQLGSLQCEYGGLTYVLDGTSYKGPKKGKLQHKILETLPIFIIATPQTTVQ